MTIGPGWEKGKTAFFAAGAHDLVLFQIVDKIVDLCGGGKAYRPKFAEPNIYLSFLAHQLPPKNSDIAVKAYTTDIVNQSDFRVFHLHIPCLSSELEYDGSDLGAARCPYGMTLG
jgi:hypothetical protein